MRIFLCDIIPLPFAEPIYLPMGYSRRRTANFNHGANSHKGTSYTFGQWMTTGVCETTVVKFSYRFALKLFKATVNSVITQFRSEPKLSRDAYMKELLLKSL